MKKYILALFLSLVCVTAAAQNFSFQYNDRKDSFGFSFGGPRPRYDYYQPAPIVPIYPTIPYYVAPPAPIYPIYPYYRPYNCPPHHWGHRFNDRNNGGHGHNHGHNRHR